MLNRIGTVVGVAFVAVLALMGYSLVKSHITAEVYRDRLASLGEDYEQLRDTYNQAVRKTAVTELLVENGEVCVNIRTAEGVIRQIPTPFDPRKEIYVDFVVLNGRLWIRRVFDEDTPPGQGVTVNPELMDIDWDLAIASHGKAAYRRLTSGRWAVSVSGDGSLTLARVDPGTELELVAPPRLGEFDVIEQEAAAAVEDIGPTDVLKRLVSP